MLVLLGLLCDRLQGLLWDSNRKHGSNYAIGHARRRLCMKADRPAKLEKARLKSAPLDNLSLKLRNHFAYTNAEKKRILLILGYKDS